MSEILKYWKDYYSMSNVLKYCKWHENWLLMESINLKALREDYKFCILQNGFSLKIGSSYITPCNIANTMNNTINKFQICPLTHDRKLKGGLGRANDYAIHRITSSVEIWKFHLQTNCVHPVTHFLLRAFSSSTHFFSLDFTV